MARVLVGLARLRHGWRGTSPSTRATLLTLALLSVLLPLWWVGTRWYRQRLMDEARNAVSAELWHHGQYLSIAFDSRLAALAGVAAFVYAEAEHSGRLTDAALAAFWDGLVAGDTALRRLAVAPGGIEQYVYSRPSSHATVGSDLLHDSRAGVQREVNTCIASRRVTVGSAQRDSSGAGWTVTAYQPIFLEDRLWGLATLEFDLSQILADSEFDRAATVAQLALRDSAGSVLYGDPTVFENDPIVLPITVRDEWWELAGIPAHGWERAIRAPWLAYQGVTLLCVALIAALVFLGVSRQGQLADAVHARTAELVDANVLLERRVARRTRELSILYQVTTLANQSFDLDALLQRSLDWLVAAMECRSGAVFLADEAEGVLRLRVWNGIPASRLSRLRTIPLHGGLEGWVFTERKPLVLDDLAADPRAVLAEHIRGRRGYVGVPISSRGRTLGVLSLVYPADRPIAEEDVTLLISVGEQLGVAVENATLFGATRDRATLEERQRLARELHDSVTQSLYSLTLFTEAGRHWAEDGNLEGVRGNLMRIAETAQQALKDMRLLVYELRPPRLNTDGLIGALRHRLDAVERRAGIEVRLEVETLPALAQSDEEQLYQIALQALNNSLQHARASEVRVRLASQAGELELEVADNGVGFEPQAVGATGGMGLATMRERAERIGGRLQVLSAPGRGTIVRVVVPERAQADAEG
jgi:signal transduction histidine kinase